MGFKQSCLLEKEVYIPFPEMQSRPDAMQGVRALLIDKDGNPSWTQKNPGQVSRCYASPISWRSKSSCIADVWYNVGPQVPMIDVHVMFAPMHEGDALGLTDSFNPGGMGSRSSL